MHHYDNIGYAAEGSADNFSNLESEPHMQQNYYGDYHNHYNDYFPHQENYYTAP